MHRGVSRLIYLGWPYTPSSKTETSLINAKKKQCFRQKFCLTLPLTHEFENLIHRFSTLAEVSQLYCFLFFFF